uniref:FXYD domain-containing ion transport regulator n=1 Tax=Denticeps clupeoides TaxID=299321 RepID=A0AAY4B069_9TELE
MGQVANLVLLAVLSAVFATAEGNAFTYNYERLRIGGLIITALLVAGAVVILSWNKCKAKSSKDADSPSEI